MVQAVMIYKAGDPILVSQFLIAGFQSVHAQPNGVFDQPAHLHDLRLNTRQIGIESRRYMCIGHVLSNPAGDVAFGSGIAGCGEDLIGIAVFDQTAKMKKGRLLADPRGLVHRMGNNHHAKVLAQIVD